MTILPQRWSPDQLAQLFQTVQSGKPAYAHICSWFEKVFSLQEAALSTCRPPSISIDAERRVAQQKGGLPLVERRNLRVDWPAMETLFHRLCEAAIGENDYLTAAAAAMNDKRQRRQLDLARFGALLLADDGAAFQKEARSMDLASEVLAFFIYHSIWPSAAVQLDRLKGRLPTDEAWPLGYCPFCGGGPMLSLLAENNGRSLVCSFCRHTWTAPRIFCPHCENTDADTLGYFFSESEPEYRVHTCLKCKGYLKAVDLRQLMRPLHPFLEAAITAHLDMRARDDGYRDMAPVWVHIG